MNLNEVLEKHEMWLKDEEGGECANLSGADLKHANLSDVDLSYANLSGADLKHANLENADLSHADLKNVNFSDADLSNVDLSYANLYNVNLSDTNLYNADLRHANLRNVKTNMYTIGYSLACPEEGSFIGYKKANRYLVKLLILEDAKRSSATTMKCRCDKAKVLDIENIKTGLKVMKVSSNYNSNFIYKVGEIVTVDNFDDNRWNECAPGIHFFMNKENAINYY